jgi:4a-hydroxytetrahydrobiopterin dehydratase
MSTLADKRCIPCEGGIAPMTPEEITQELSHLREWTVSSDHTKITKRFEFKNFYKTMAFVNAVAWVSHSENHHPDMEVGYNYCIIHYSTHAIKGLSLNDFICAAKIERILAL